MLDAALMDLARLKVAGLAERCRRERREEPTCTADRDGNGT
jgi:hypothetical protein